MSFCCTDLSQSPQPEAYIMTTTPVAAAPAALPVPFSNLNVKDSRWLTLEVCREFQRNRCTRTDQECKFAHPPTHVESQNGRVMCCFDSIKGKCQRKEPPCKYLHPPQHLKEQLLQNGRHNLALRNVSSMLMSPYGSNNQYHWNQLLAQNQQFAAPMQPTAMINPTMGMGLPAPSLAGNPYLYNQYAGMGQLPLVQPIASAGSLESQALAQLPTTTTASSTSPNGTAQKAPRADRLEVCPEFTNGGACPLPEPECSFAHPPDYVLTEDDLAVVCMDFVKGKCTREHCKYYHPTPKLLQKVNQNRAALAAANQVSTQTAQAFTHALNVAAVAAAANSIQQSSMQTGVGGMPVKRPAIDMKGGIQMFQPAAYQQLTMAPQPGQQAYVPVSFYGYDVRQHSVPSYVVAGHPAGMPRL